uniref:DUF38 domain-containing protein n=1 Tax=Panagrolaimus davidi TaxID=227884 RepID=A0A914QZ23_9BILA
MDLPVGSIAAVISRVSLGPPRVRATIPSRRTKFFTKYFRQNFSLPDSIMHYIEKNPKTWKLYQKMIQACKYFFVKNPILVVRYLYHNKDDLWCVDNRLLIDLKKIKCKFWVTKEFYVPRFPDVKNINPNIVSSNISKLYKCGASFLELGGQTISYHDLSFLISDAKEIVFEDVTVKDENGKILPLEKLIEASIKAERIHIVGPTMTSKTFNELTKITHFANLDSLTLYGLNEDFDVEDFYVYMKKNQRTKFKLWFDSSISDGYKARIEEIIDEIKATKVFGYRRPSIEFDELDE